MTSETSFAQYHTSTWRLLSPAMDLYIRKINLHLYQREFPILKSDISSGRRGLINEIAFIAYCTSPAKARLRKLTDYVLSYASRKASERISLLEDIPLESIATPNESEIDDLTEQVRRLRLFFSRTSEGHPIEINPQFPGAGIIGSCEGDIYFNSTLFEVKAGQRMFRSVDLKQLLTYGALNNASRLRPLNHLGLFNPRMGVSFIAALDDICLEISGCMAAELLPEITRVISSGDISR